MNSAHHGTICVAKPATYKIEVQGKLDPSWVDMFGTLRLEHRLNQEGVATTALTGRLPDQAALAGLLNLTYTLGMPLLSVALLGAGSTLATDKP